MHKENIFFFLVDLYNVQLNLERQYGYNMLVSDA
jgi:hypothetical protein